MQVRLGAFVVPLVTLLAGPCDASDAKTATPPPAVDVAAPGFVDVSLGADDFGCSLRADGSVQCWNYYLGGESPEGMFSAVSVSYGSACGIRVGGLLVCWGRDSAEVFSPLDGEYVAVGHGLWTTCGVRVDGALVCSNGVRPAGRFVSVSVGYRSACAVRADGAVVCWGGYSRGPPEGRLVDEGPFVSVDVGANHGCGVGVDGAVACWPPGRVGGYGGAHHGQSTPPAGSFADVAVSSLFSCGLRADGEVVCWGAARPDRCGDIDRCPGWAADPIPPGPFMAFDVGWSGILGADGSVCAVRVGGEIVCWGDGEARLRPPAGVFAAIDVSYDAACGLRPDGRAVCWGRVDWLGEVPGGAFTALSVTRSHACGLRPGGDVACWGDNTWGAAAPPPGRFVAVAVAERGVRRQSCGLRRDGEAVCWGSNRYGLADPPPGPFVAIEVPQGLEGIVACGLRPDGETECWGPSWVDVEPEEVFASPDFDDPTWRGTFPGGEFSAVSSYGNSACGIRLGGALECWSPRWHPGLGVPDPDAPTAVVERDQGGAEPVGVSEDLAWVNGELPGGPYVALDSGWYHTCGMLADHTVECHGTGGSPDGEFTGIDVGAWEVCGLGVGGAITCLGFVRDEVRVVDLALSPSEDLIDVAGRCGLLATGELVCPGSEPPGQERTPGPYAQVSAGSGYVVHFWAAHPSEESSHVCAVDRAGRIECWGGNGSGQTAGPPSWLDDPPYSAIAAGFAHTCAIGASGGVVCWGDDRHDQTDSPPGEFTALGAGQWHTCALRSDGEIACWGDGPADIDQDYDDPPPGVPREPPPGPFNAVAAGQWHTCALRPDGTATCWLSY